MGSEQKTRLDAAGAREGATHTHTHPDAIFTEVNELVLNFGQKSLYRVLQRGKRKHVGMTNKKRRRRGAAVACRAAEALRHEWARPGRPFACSWLGCATRLAATLRVCARAQSRTTR